MINKVCQHIVDHTDFEYVGIKKGSKRAVAFMTGRALFYLDNVEISKIKETIEILSKKEKGQTNMSSFF